MSLFNGRNDNATLILSLIALLLAGVLSINTFSGQVVESSLNGSSDPFDRAQVAAQAGIEIARWHIECNGRTIHGSLPSHFWINGATYTVEWGDVDMVDSTVDIRSKGETSTADDFRYQVVKEVKLKISFLPMRKNEILSDYYSQERPPINDMQSR